MQPTQNIRIPFQVTVKPDSGTRVQAPPKIDTCEYFFYQLTLVLDEDSEEGGAIADSGFVTVYARTDNGRFALGTLTVAKENHVLCQRIRMKLSGDELKGLECVFNNNSGSSEAEPQWSVMVTGEQRMELTFQQMAALQQ